MDKTVKVINPIETSIKDNDVKRKKQVDKEFGLSSWAINNKTTMYVLIAVILLFRYFCLF